MSNPEPGEPAPRMPLRLWPGFALAALVLLLRFALPATGPESPLVGITAMLGSVLAALAIAVWWLFFSRAPRTERLGAVALAVVALIATKALLLHHSLAGGMMGFMFYLYAVPLLAVAVVVWAAATQRLREGARRAWLVAVILLACAVWTPLRIDGIMGEGTPQFAWRWTPTAEELLVRNAGATALPAAARRPDILPAPLPVEAPAPPATPGAAPAGGTPAISASEIPPPVPAATKETPNETKENVATPAATATALEIAPPEWPGFRGRDRDGKVSGVRIATDWTAFPPKELWRRAVGPGWSSFAVRGHYVYTQEQRGEHEVVACYDLRTGEPVWAHRDAARFYEANAGAGPRATPTVSGSRVYTLGATGILNALDARTGAKAWSRNAPTDTGTGLPGWGFSASPLVVDDVVIVATAGALAAYDAATGERRWNGPDGESGYSSPHLATLHGVVQVLFMSGRGITSVDPSTGKVLWEHRLGMGARIVQPSVVGDGDVLVADNEQEGMRRLAVSRTGDGWTVSERWATRGLKPYFNDFVVHNGHAFGFDGSILSCIDLADGARRWKGGRYGHGQVVLLPDQDLLLVLAEEGDLALVRAVPDGFTELARVPALHGKTWNHPVIVGNVLLVRNGEEMAAFRLPVAGS